VVARVPVRIEPFDIAIVGDTLWVNESYEDDPGVNAIVRIDLRTDKAVATVTNGKTNLGEPFLTMAASPVALWFVDWQSQTIKRLDPATNKVVATIKTNDSEPSYQVVDGSSVWVTSHFLNLVTRIDARTNKVVAYIPLNGYPSGTESADCCGQTLAVGAGSVWTIAGSGSRTLVGIDPQTNQVTASLTFPQSIGPVAFMHGSVWVEGPDTFYRIDPAAMKGT
jgi:YVTN family beta-propeller protein